MMRPASTITSLPTQVLRTYKRLVQYIYSEGLEMGDRLPPQDELRSLLGKNHYTLSGAMQALANQGVLARKSGAGTVICDLTAIGAVPWSIGVATIEAPVDGELSVFANLAMRMQTRLNRDGCRCLSYSRPVSDAFTQLHHFGLLKSDVEDGILDGLVLLTPLQLQEWDALQERQLPLLHLPFWEEAPSGIIIDQEAYVREAVQQLAQRDCRTFGVATVAKPDELPRPRFLTGLKKGLAECGLPQSNGAWLNGRFGQAAGERIARELLAARADQRPDGLILLDDFTALGLTTVLSQSGSYRPEIAVQVHAQLPLQYPLPVQCYAIDLEALVERAVMIMQSRLRQPGLPTRLEYADGAFQVTGGAQTADLLTNT